MEADLAAEDGTILILLLEKESGRGRLSAIRVMNYLIQRHTRWRPVRTVFKGGNQRTIHRGPIFNMEREALRTYRAGADDTQG